jgi:RND family efflux transporter MFP subunit
VEVAVAKVRDIKSTLPVTGALEAYHDVVLSAEASGRVDWVGPGEGDAAQRGQVLVKIDTRESDDQIAQAEAALTSAVARLNEARKGLTLQEVQTSTQIEQARAGLTAAQKRLEILQKGARPQELQVAQNAVLQAEANFNNAQKQFRRLEQLFQQGAVPENQVDAARAQFEVASAQLASARQQLSLTREGPRTEEIDAAQSLVDQAREQLRVARAGEAQVEMRRAEVQTAAAGVAQAQAAVGLVRTNREKRIVRSPIQGVVINRLVEPGESVMGMAGTPMFRIANIDSVYFKTNVSELDLTRLRRGQSVQVKVDGIPGRLFRGAVDKIVPVAKPGSRDFVVHVKIENPSHRLRPGMFARGEILLEVRRNSVVVPAEAIVSRKGSPAVFVAESGRARMRRPKLGLRDEVEAQLLFGVEPGERVVITGNEALSDGDKISVR